jgi:hypothetical protein
MNTVILAWAFSPADYFEELTEIHGGDYAMKIADGKVEAQIDAAVFDRDPSIRRALDEALNDRFLGVQLLVHQAYTLSKSSMARIDGEGRRTIFVEPGPATLLLQAGRPDLMMTDKDGKVVLDTRKDRIERKRKLAELSERHSPKDELLRSLLRSYQAAVYDPGNELVHLYDIGDALKKKFGGESQARTSVGITKPEWQRLGELANTEPLRQGRHRGINYGRLRDATDGELAEARGIARKMVENYLRLL